MTLTKNAETDFLKWLRANYPLGAEAMKISGIRNSFQQTLIIEWLDSVGIYIQHWSSGGSFIEKFDVDVAYKGKLHSSDEFYPTRGEAIESGIKIANEIYNTRVSKAEGEKLS